MFNVPKNCPMYGIFLDNKIKIKIAKHINTMVVLFNNFLIV